MTTRTNRTSSGPSSSSSTSSNNNGINMMMPTLFVQKDHHGNYRPTSALLLLLMSVPIGVLSGNLSWGVTTFVAALIVATCHAVQQIQEEDKQQIRYDVLHAEDVAHEMIQWEDALLGVQSRRNSAKNQNTENNNNKMTQTIMNDATKSTVEEDARFLEKGRLVIHVGLNALAKKYGKYVNATTIQQKRKQRLRENQSKNLLENSDDRMYDQLRTTIHEHAELLPLWCQRASYIGLRCFPNDDEIVASSISLLALAVKDPRVRQRHLDSYHPRIQIIDEKKSTTKATTIQRRKNTKNKMDETNNESTVKEDAIDGDSFADDDDNDDYSYTLDVPIQALQRALVRAKDLDPDNIPGTRQIEQQCAELQRKGCLFLGAISNNDGNNQEDRSNMDSCAGGGERRSADDASTTKESMSSIIVQKEHGLHHILDVLDWYRYHADIANWGLWSIFTLCYENDTNKRILLENSGIPIVLQTLENICVLSDHDDDDDDDDDEKNNVLDRRQTVTPVDKNHVEVARHGIAILFDLMREDNDSFTSCNTMTASTYTTTSGKLDVWKIRNSAIEIGLHPILIKTMRHYVTEMDIIMMGQEILIGTGYQTKKGNADDEIPQFNPLGNTQF